MRPPGKREAQRLHPPRLRRRFIIGRILIGNGYEDVARVFHAHSTWLGFGPACWGRRSYDVFSASAALLRSGALGDCMAAPVAIPAFSASAAPSWDIILLNTA